MLTPRPGSLTAALLVCLVSMGLAAPRVAAHSPHDVTPVIAVSPDYDTDGLVIASFQFTEYRLLGRSVDGGRSWSVYSNAMTIDSITDIEFSPLFGQDGTLFATTFGGGVWRSTDRGLGWQPINSGLTDLMVRDLTVSPAFGTDQTLAVVTNSGPFVSQDGGATWVLSVAGLIESKPVEIAFDTSGGALYTGQKVLHRSLDHGATWVPLHDFATNLSCIAFDPSDPSGSTLAVSFGRFGMGASFQSSSDGLTDMRVGNVRFAVDGSMLAVSFEGGCHLAAAPLQPFAASATGLESLSDLSQEHFFLALPSPGFDRDGIILLASFEGFYLSFDGGQSWQQQETYSLRLNRQLVFSPEYADDGVVVASSYGAGISVASPPGLDPGAPPGGGALLEDAAPADLMAATLSPGSPHHPAPPVTLPASPTWKGRSTGLHTIWGSELLFSPTFAVDRTLIYAHIGIYKSTDMGRHWQPIPMPSSFVIVRAIALSNAFAEDHTMFTGGGEGQGVYRSEDGGDTWFELTGQGGLPPQSRASVLACSPDFADDGTLFLATTNAGVWRSTDRGDTWVSLGFDDEQVRTLALSPFFHQDRTLFLGMDSQGAFRSTDGGDTWQPVDLAITDMSTYTVQSFGFSPRFKFDGEIFALTRQGHVRFSTDHGQSWVARDQGLTDQALRVLAVSPSYRDDELLMVSSHDWIWRSRDKGLSWSRLPGWVRVDDSHQSALASGNWVSHVMPMAIAPGPSVPGTADHNGPGVRVTTTVGDWTELEFYGTSVAFYAERDSASGIVRIDVDGVPAALVDLYAPTSLPQQAIFEHAFGAEGWHTLRVTLTADQNPAATGRSLRSDGFHYTFVDPLPQQASTASWPYSWLEGGRAGWRLDSPRALLRPSLARQLDAHQGCAPVEPLDAELDADTGAITADAAGDLVGDLAGETATVGARMRPVPGGR